MTQFDFFLSDETVKLCDERIEIREPTLANVRASQNAAANNELLRFSKHTNQHVAGLTMMQKQRQNTVSQAGNKKTEEVEEVEEAVSDLDVFGEHYRLYDMSTLLEHCIVHVDDVKNPPAGKNWVDFLNPKTCILIYANIMRSFILVD